MDRPAPTPAEARQGREMDCAPDFHQAKELAERAHASMLEHGVPPSPRNFTVWYQHHTGHIAELSATIHQMIEHGQVFTPERNDDLYARFVAHDDAHLDSIQQVSDTLSSMLSRMMSYIEAAAGDTQAYNARLDSFSERLESKPTLDGLKTIVSDLVAETQRVIQRNRSMENQL